MLGPPQRRLAAASPATCSWRWIRSFKSCFLAWINGLRDACSWTLDPRDAPEIIAVDGKTSRRSHDRRKGRNPLHLVSAWAARQRIVLGQHATEEKSNETTAIPLLLKHLDLKGALVTMDAMGTQTDIACAIREGGRLLHVVEEELARCACPGRAVVHPSARRCDVRKQPRRGTWRQGGSKAAGTRSVIRSTG
jgi:Transposase DDE domain